MPIPMLVLVPMPISMPVLVSMPIPMLVLEPMPIPMLVLVLVAMSIPMPVLVPMPMPILMPVPIPSGAPRAPVAPWVRKNGNLSMRKILVKASGMARGRVRLRRTAYGIRRTPYVAQDDIFT